VIIVEEISTDLSLDLIGSFLRSKINGLQELLNSIENSNRIDSGYTVETLKLIEIDLKRIRKLFVNN
jgi:hypothetical protein